MPGAEVNGVTRYYELHGSGEPLALAHGSAPVSIVRDLWSIGIADRGVRSSND